jgi:hypothetical protein
MQVGDIGQSYILCVWYSSGGISVTDSWAVKCIAVLLNERGLHRLAIGRCSGACGTDWLGSPTILQRERPSSSRTDLQVFPIKHLTLCTSKPESKPKDSYVKDS